MSEPSHVHIETWGTLGHLNASQQEALDQFKTKVELTELDKTKFQVESYDNVSLRFLRARSFNVQNAVQLLHDCIKRKESGHSTKYINLTPDECANCDLETLKRWYPHAIIGYDRFNRPLLFEHSGAVDANAIYQMTTLEGLVNYHWYSMDNVLNKMFDKAAEKCKEGENVLISTCVILDFTGLNMHHGSTKVLDHVKAMIAIDNMCYPEILGKMLVINAPWLAVSLYEMVKHWLDPRTQNKIEILGSGPDTVKRLLEFVSPEHLPKSFGGSGPEILHFHRTHADYVHINRHSAVKKVIAVKVGQKVSIDTYTTEGDVGLEIYSNILPKSVFDTSSRLPQTHEQISFSDCHKIAAVQGTVTHEKLELKSAHDHKPIRTFREYHATEHDLVFTILWSNSARFVTRPLVYSIVVHNKEVNDNTTNTDATTSST